MFEQGVRVEEVGTCIEKSYYNHRDDTDQWGRPDGRYKRGNEGETIL